MTAVNFRGPIDTSATTAARKQWLAAVFAPPKGSVVVRCEATELYRLFVALNDSCWWGVDLHQVTSTPGSYALHQIACMYGAAPMLSVADGDGSITRSGSWSGSTSNANAYNDAYRQTSTTGDYVEFATPSSTVRVGLRAVHTSNAGICKVTVNGDATLANLLPTAQDLVNQGVLASSALVANGGSLSPTDRVLDQYRSTNNNVRFDTVTGIVDGLTAGSHTVRLTNTGYRNTSASDDRLYMSGFSYATVSTTVDTVGADLLPLEYLTPPYDCGSAFEFAHETVPSSGSYTFLGNIHGYETQDSLTVYVDGQSRSMSAGDEISGTTVDVVRVSHLRHPDYGSGSSNLADVTTVYRMSPSGLDVSWKATWLASATVRSSYPAMQPLSSLTFTKASVANDDVTSDYSLTAHDGSFLIKKRSEAGYVWQPSGHWAALLLSRDRANVAGWTKSSPDYWMVHDRNYSLVKQYVSRVAGSFTESVSNGTVWRGSVRHMVQWFADPDVVLAR